MFDRLSIPTPFQIGSVNAYLTERTLVDPGPDSEEAWSALVDELAERDLTPDDVERVLVTHPHTDHFGLANRFSDRGAAVVASEAAASIVSDFPAWLEHEQRFFEPFLVRCGFSEEAAETMVGLPESYLNFAASVDVDRAVTDGDEFAIDGTTLSVRSVEGHAIGEIIFKYEAEGERRALVGDNVLLEITPNPLLQPPRNLDEDRPRVLPAFNRSLDGLADRPFDRFLPGHRGLVDDPSGRIGEIREAHEERTENVAGLVDGPTTPVEVMDGLFGDLPMTEAFPGISEAVGHLDVLEARGRVRREKRGGVFVYEPAGQ